VSDAPLPTIEFLQDENERLRARIVELEVLLAHARGTLGTLEPPDADFIVYPDAPPSTPR